MDKYSADEKIVIAEIDCVENRKICDELFPTTGWPSFVDFFKGKGTLVSVERTIESFSRKVEELKDRKFVTPCLAYPADVGKEAYPMFVYSNGSGNDTLACNDLLLAFKYAPDVASKVFYLSNGTRREYWVKINSRTIINYTGKIVLPQMVKWTQEWSMIPFGPWSLEAGIQVQRRFAFMISVDVFQTYPFGETALSYLDSVLVGRMNVDEFIQKQGITVKTPALVLSNIQKDRFHIVNNVTVQDFNQIMKDYIAGRLEDKMTLQLDLFRRSTVPVRQAQAKQTDSVLEKGTLITVSIVVGCSIIAILVVCYLRRNRTGKIE